MIEPTTIPTRRACGKRVAAGVYAETRLSPFGQPVESYLLCPPKPIDIVAWGLTPRGARLVEMEGRWHIFDIVSKADYAVADYVEETRCKGASRRLACQVDFSKLTANSRLVLIHEQAIIENVDHYPQPPVVCCPLDLHRTPLEEMCAGLWWHDFPVEALQPLRDLGGYRRTLPGGVSYFAHPRPAGLLPRYHHAIFMSLPVTNLVVIAGRNPQEDARAKTAFQAAIQGGLPVFMEAE
jgi:hypothetical protein